MTDGSPRIMAVKIPLNSTVYMWWKFCGRPSHGSSYKHILVGAKTQGYKVSGNPRCLLILSGCPFWGL